MVKPPLYNKWQLIFFGGMCSASICSVSFSGSFIDCLISFPLGCLLIIIQLFAAKHELYSNVFEYVPQPGSGWPAYMLTSCIELLSLHCLVLSLRLSPPLSISVTQLSPLPPLSSSSL